MKPAVFLILMFLAVPATALYDAYGSLDSKGAEMCISVDGFDNPSCNMNETVVFDGTTDHVLYLTPYVSEPKNESFNAQMRFYVGETMGAALAVGGFVIMAFIALAGVYVYQETILKRGRHGF